MPTKRTKPPAGPAARAMTEDPAADVLGAPAVTPRTEPTPPTPHASTARDTRRTEDTSATAEKSLTSRMGRPPLPEDARSTNQKMTLMLQPATIERIKRLWHKLEVDSRSAVVDAAVAQLARENGIE